MWPVQIIVDSPFLDDLTGMAITAEQVLVEALVPQPPVKAFDEAVIRHVVVGANVGLVVRLDRLGASGPRGTGSTQVRAGRRMQMN